MEEIKTLVEELREMVELSIASNQYPTVHADAIIGHLCVSKSDERELFTAIADRIEREYLPRPRFEDGEPVQFGDEFYSDEHGSTYKATMFVIYADGSYRVNQAGCNACQYEQGERVKRMQPDTLERIEDDAMKTFSDYWGCGDAECSCCPAIVDGKKPYERYENSIDRCSNAQRLDLLRRQREVLERGQA